MKFKVAIVSLIFVVSFLQMFAAMPQSASAASVAHGVIAINGNSEFATMATTEGWKGDGTISNPYLISGYDIDATGHSCGILIGNTTAYFEINNCTIHGASREGITIRTVQHAVITHVISRMNGLGGIGILDHSGNNTITRNTLGPNAWGGVHISNYCSYNLISYNNCSDSTAAPYSDGIDIDTHSHHNQIVRNLCWNNPFTGIFLDSSDNNAIENNSCRNNTGIGISINSFSSMNNVANNNCSNNRDGIAMNDRANTYTRNILYNNQVGISFYSGSNTIFHNNFIGNSVHADQDNGGSTISWDIGYPAGGNYWSGYSGSDQFSGASQNVPGSDGIIDTPYQVDGSNVDNYPLKNPYPITFDIDPPVSAATVTGTVVTLSSSDDVSGVNRTMYRVDNGSWQVYSTPINITQAGNHTVEYYSVDSSGNAEDVKSVSVVVQGGGGGGGTGGTPGGLPFELIAALAAAIVIAILIVLSFNRKKKRGKTEEANLHLIQKRDD